MIVDTKQFAGECACGSSHSLQTKTIVIEKNCLARFDEYLAQANVSGKICALYDDNTYCAKNLIRPKAQQEIVLNHKNLHANEKAIGETLSKLDDDVNVIVAVGSGTIHDVARYVAFNRNLRFVSCPTAASVDGFCSSVAALTIGGAKKTVPAKPPEIVLADTAVFSSAPQRLTRSGVGDLLGKATSLADWRIAHLLTNERYCEKTAKIVDDALALVLSAQNGLKANDEDAVNALMNGLILSGIAMQLVGNSRPASGAEHHFSHLIEINVPSIAVGNVALHGEKVGVGTLYLYKSLATQKPKFKDFVPATDDYVRANFGDALFAGIKKENSDACLSSLTTETLAQKWDGVVSILSALPSVRQYPKIYDNLGLGKTLGDIGIDESKLGDVLRLAPMTRNRLTLLKIFYTMIDS